MTDPSQPSLDPSETSSVVSPSSQKKRSRATAEQLAILEDTFAVNVSPNSKLRAQLSARLNMTERRLVFD
jgi:Homeodomain